jgi:hypothetical protein
MRNIKFAGLSSEWKCDYAKTYSDKLHEMGYCAKVLENKGYCIVAYSHRGFAPSDAMKVLQGLKNQK